MLPDEEYPVPAPALAPLGLRAPAERSEARVLAGNALLAVLIAVLGLAVASALPLTTNAQVSQGSPGAETGTAPTEPQTASGQPTRSPALRTALIREVAAQRAEQLAKTAERADRAAREANGRARQQKLAEGSRAAHAAAARIAQQRLQEAVAARQAAERAAANDGAGPPLTDGSVTTGTIPAGATGVPPVPRGVVGAHFGQYGSWSRYHTGLDFRAAYGVPIRAVLPGVVLYAGNAGNWAGNHVAVRHADGQTTMYSHMSSMAASAGQSVQAGQVIGYVGQTGRAFGAHLHFELYPVGVKYGDVYKAVNPAPWLRRHGIQTR